MYISDDATPEEVAGVAEEQRYLASQAAQVRRFSFTVRAAVGGILLAVQSVRELSAGRHEDAGQ